MVVHVSCVKAVAAGLLEYLANYQNKLFKISWDVWGPNFGYPCFVAYK